MGNQKDKIIELRKMMNMNKSEFSKHFEIPYRTLQDWEAERRIAPKYVINLLEYRVLIECYLKELNNKENKEK